MLLILAGVALATLTGQGNIIGNAENALGKYNNSVASEQQLLNEIEKYLIEHTNNGNTDSEEMLQIIIETSLTGGTVSGDTIIKFNKGDTLKESLKNANIMIEANEGYALDKIKIENIGEFTNLEELKNAENVLNNNITIIPIFEPDVIGMENPHEGDGIADKYQLVVTFASEDSVRGTLSFDKTVLTMYDERENFSSEGIAKLSEGNIPDVTALGRYMFDHWTDPQGTEYTTEELLEIELDADTTLTAHFRYVSSSGHDET